MKGAVSKELRKLIGEKGYETLSGRISFPKVVRDKYRKEIGDYKTDEVLIKAEMIEIYNQ